MNIELVDDRGIPDRAHELAKEALTEVYRLAEMFGDTANPADCQVLAITYAIRKYSIDQTTENYQRDTGLLNDIKTLIGEAKTAIANAMETGHDVIR